MLRRSVFKSAMVPEGEPAAGKVCEAELVLTHSVKLTQPLSHTRTAE